MDELIDTAQRLAGVSFATFLILVLILGFFEIWIWGRTHKRIIADYEARLERERARTAKWEERFERLAGWTETAMEVAKRRR
jgi:hypothetical protein